MNRAGPCRECTEPVPAGARFCMACGTAVSLDASRTERRQVTILFCDMVGSTELSERLDPEDLGDLLNSYQRVCRDAIVRHGGHVSQYLGDGVLAYFGYPIAHSDDAERAIRAALGILDTIKLTNQGIGKRLGEEIHVRVGLHTGVVAITSGPAGGERLAVGESVNLAARIQTIAPIDTVLVSAGTAELAGGYFEVEALKAQTLKGFSKPVELFRVVRPTGARTRLEAAARSRLTPHVGRELELGYLAAAWKAVRDGAERAILLQGEPGIGKSRVVLQFRQSVLEEGAIVLECLCSPLTQSSALAPVVEMLYGRVAERAEAPLTPEIKLETLRVMLCEHSRFGPDALPLLAALLSIPGADEAPIAELSGVRRRVRTLELLREWLASSAERVPIVLLFEDLHWADPTTLDLLDLLMRDNLRGRALLCMTARPEFAARWSETRVQTLELARLNAAEIDAMVQRVDGSESLPPFFAKRIAQRSEGVPLYVEEITKLVLDHLRTGGVEWAMTLGEQLLPSTVRGMLQGRLDQVSKGRRTAQLGAAIGREFSYPLIRAVSGIAEEDLRQDLESLKQSELVFAQGEPPESVYIFKHALIQDAIYQMLPKPEREAFHERIFSALEREFPELVAQRPEVAAHHAEKANLREAAIRLLRDAGILALRRPAVAEAVQHLRHGLSLLEPLAEPARTTLEIDLQAAIGPAYMAKVGWAAPEVEAASQRLFELASQRGDHEKIYQAMWGLWTVHFVRGELHAAMDVARNVYGAAKASGDPMLRITGCHALGYTAYSLGELETARSIAKEAIALSTLELEMGLASVFQLSSGAICYGFCIGASWLLGEQDQAAALTLDWHALLAQLKHAPTMALSLAFEGYVLHMQREPAKLRLLALKLRTIAEQEGFDLWISMSYVFEAWSLSQEGQVMPAVEQMNAAIDGWRATNSQLCMSYNMAMQVEVFLLAGQADQALRVIAEGKELCHRVGERSLEPEFHRLEGEALEMLGLHEAALAATAQAIERARELGALSLELRAATQAHRLSKSGASLELLRKVYSKFKEGFEKSDLRAARAYLGFDEHEHVEQIAP